MKLKIVLISLISVLILLPVTHGAVSIYKDLKQETQIVETEVEDSGSESDTTSKQSEEGVADL